MCEGGGNCLKYLKGGGTGKRGGETKNLKRGQAGSEGGYLKKDREAGTPFRTNGNLPKSCFNQIFHILKYITSSNPKNIFLENN